jgi:hypothetical protein
MGLRRHQIENLILRGPIFYWRARIPVGFNAAGRNARLSLSLRLSDRKKASVVARRLNAFRGSTRRSVRGPRPSIPWETVSSYSRG